MIGAVFIFMADGDFTVPVSPPEIQRPLAGRLIFAGGANEAQNYLECLINQHQIRIKLSLP